MKWAGIAWRVALTALLGMLTWQVYGLRHAPAWVQAQIQREADATRAMALAAVSDSRRDLLAEVALTRADLLKQVGSLQQDTGVQVTALRTDLLARVDKIEADLLGPDGSLKTDLLARVDAVRGDVQPLVKSTGRVLDAAAEQADLMGRCEQDGFGNPDCLANRVIPALKNFERMAAAGEKVANAVAAEAQPTAQAVREGAQQVTGIATDIHTVTTDMVAPVPWYKKLGRVAYDALELLARWF